MPVFSSSRPTVLRDDRELEQVALPPTRPLFPLLDSAADAMFPLIIALAVLPGLYAAMLAPLSETGALQGLKALQWLSPPEVADPGSSVPQSLDQLHFQPPLMTWLTAVSLRLAGTSGDLGLRLPALLCTAGLLLATYALARRLGGKPLAVISVVLLSFHPLVLEGAQQPTPAAAAGLTAVVTLAAMLTHWQKSASIISYQLLLAGVSLGLCVLAGGLVSLAVIFVLLCYIAVWRSEAHVRGRRGTASDRGQFSRRTALQSVAVLLATAFALSGWYLLKMQAQHGAEFWNAWFHSGILPAHSAPGLPQPAPFDGARFFQLTWPLLGLSLAGLGSLGRDLISNREDPSRRHRLLLFPWIGVMVLELTRTAGATFVSPASLQMWELSLTIPLVISGAIGFLEIAERRLSFQISLAATLVVLVPVVVQIHSGPTPLNDVGLSPEVPYLAQLEISMLAIVAIVLASLAVIRLSRLAESEQRLILMGALLIVVGLNCWWGTRPSRELAAGPRPELDELQSALRRYGQVTRLIFQTAGAGNPEYAGEIPGRLTYRLAGQWPGATLVFVTAGDQALSLIERTSSAEDSATTLLVELAQRGTVRNVAPHPSWKLIAPPAMSDDREISVYAREAP